MLVLPLLRLGNRGSGQTAREAERVCAWERLEGQLQNQATEELTHQGGPAHAIEFLEQSLTKGLAPPAPPGICRPSSIPPLNSQGKVPPTA